MDCRSDAVCVGDEWTNLSRTGKFTGESNFLVDAICFSTAAIDADNSFISVLLSLGIAPLFLGVVVVPVPVSFFRDVCVPDMDEIIDEGFDICGVRTTEEEEDDGGGEGNEDNR